VRAVVVEETGGPEVLQVREREPEAPSTGHIRVDVAACGVNFIDVYQRTGAYSRPLPFVAGSEGAGTVVEVGPDVVGTAVGDRVAWAMVDGGGYAEEALIPANRAVPVPDGVELETAAAVLLQGMTAHYLCETTFPAGRAHTALVHAAAGGVGLLLTQLLAAKGTRVIATTSTREKADLARAAGADEVVLVDGFLAATKELTDGDGVDVVLDVVGGDLMTDSLRALAPGGRLLVVGFTGGAIPQVKVNRLLLNNIDVRGVGWGAYAMARPGFMRAQWDELLPMLHSGVVDPPVSRTYAVDEMGTALADLADRRTVGKSVILL
jgi:NADPH2:quinone reductase